VPSVVRRLKNPGSLRIRSFVILVATLIFTGCASNSYVVLLKSPDGTTGKVTVSGKSGEQVLTVAGQRVPLDGSESAKPESEKEMKADFGEAIAALPKLPVRYLLYFTDGVALTKASEALFPAIIAEADSRPAVDLSVIGHTDTVKSDEYNDQLALKRATRVAELLKEKGLKYHAMTIEWHGKRNLLIQTPDNTYEPKNRRVEVSVR